MEQAIRIPRTRAEALENPPAIDCLEPTLCSKVNGESVFDAFKRIATHQALILCRGNHRAMADLLGVSDQAVNRLLRQYGWTDPAGRRKKRTHLKLRAVALALLLATVAWAEPCDPTHQWYCDDETANVVEGTVTPTIIWDAAVIGPEHDRALEYHVFYREVGAGDWQLGYEIKCWDAGRGCPGMTQPWPAQRLPGLVSGTKYELCIQAWNLAGYSPSCSNYVQWCEPEFFVCDVSGCEANCAAGRHYDTSLGECIP